MPICDSRKLVPRPMSNCIFTAVQLLLSSPYRTSVPGPARPLKVGGPPPEPVNVTMRQGAASALGAADIAAKRKAVTAKAVLVMIAAPSSAEHSSHLCD